MMYYVFALLTFVSSTFCYFHFHEKADLSEKNFERLYEGAEQYESITMGIHHTLSEKKAEAQTYKLINDASFATAFISFALLIALGLHYAWEMEKFSQPEPRRRRRVGF